MSEGQNKMTENKNKSKDANSSQISTTPQQQNSQVNLVDLVNVVSDRVEPIIDIIKTLAERNLESREAEARFKIHMAWVAVVVVTIIVGVSSLLTWVGKMDGSTFGFLLGLVIGYALTFIRDALGPGRE